MLHHLCILFLSCLALGPAAHADTFQVRLEPVPDASELTVTLVDGPHAGKSSARRREWAVWIRGSSANARHLVLDVRPGVTEGQVDTFVSSVVERYGCDEVSPASGSSLSVAVERASRAVAPLVLEAVVVQEGERLDARTRSAWTGYGAVTYSAARRLGVRYGGQLFDDLGALEAALGKQHDKRPDQAWRLDVSAWRYQDLAWFRGVPARMEHERFGVRGTTVDGLERWGVLRDEPMVLYLDYDGAIFQGGEMILNPAEFRAGEGDPYGKVRAALVEATGKRPSKKVGNGVSISVARLLLVVHPSTPYTHVLSVQSVCVTLPIRLPRLDVAIAGRDPLESQPLSVALRLSISDMTDENGDPLPEHQVPVGIRIASPGKRIRPTRPGKGAAWKGDGPWVWAAGRKLVYLLPGGDVDDVDKLIGAFRGSLDDGQSFGISLDVGPGVTFRDVFSLLKRAREAGVATITAFGAQRDAKLDYSIPVQDR